MPKLTFLWHLHQPQYRTADGVVHAPWVLLHSAGEYLTLVHALATSRLGGQVLNLTPVFLEQLAAYRDGTAHDPLLAALATPARELTPEAKRELLRWGFLLHPNQLRRFPRLAELAAMAGGGTGEEVARRFTAQDLNDLQVLLVLAYAAPNLPWEPDLADLAANEAGFGESARRRATAWLAACPGRLLDAYRRLAAMDGIEISTSPWAHPIIPLLIDTRVVAQSWAPHPAPPAPVFAAPDDAAAHIRAGLETVRSFGFETVRLLAAGGFGFGGGRGSLRRVRRALARHRRRDPRFLARPQPLRRDRRRPRALPAVAPARRGTGDLLPPPRPLRLRGVPGLPFSDEADAAREFAGHLRRTAAHLGPDAGIVIALDGENPWTSYPQGGARFLATLAQELDRSSQLRPVTLAQRVQEETPATLPRLHPGSWIGGTFATWIGHDEKNRAWETLARVRALGACRGGRAWLAAEGSDWWWWFGDDNPTLLAPLYDELFRAHLRDACAAAGIAPPMELAAPIRAASTRLAVPLSRIWPPPVLDGRTSSFFEWSVATWVEAPTTARRLARAALRADADTLWLRVEARAGTGPPVPLVVTMVTPGSRAGWRLPEELPGRCAVDRVLEAALPLPQGEVMLGIECDGERFPAEGLWRLELVEVDEQ